MKSILILVFSVLANLFSVAQENQLQGLWSSSWVEFRTPQAYVDEAFDQIYHQTDLYFEGDSMWRLQLPCEMFGIEAYTAADFQFTSDSTFKYNGEVFSKQKSYDSTTVSILKRHKLNPNCYLGKWFLVRSFSGGDGTGGVFIFPFKINDVITIESAKVNGNVVQLFVGGETRTFNFRLNRDDLEYELTLTPTESWSIEDSKMWYHSWDLPPPKRRELKEIKTTEGAPLQLRFRRIV